MVKKHRIRCFLICLFMTFLVLGIWLFNGLDSLELKAIDARFKFFGHRPVNPNIVMVVVDEKSVDDNALGQWPWPRGTHGRLARRLAKAGVKALVFDTLFTERDRRSPKSDLVLANAARDTETMVSAFFFEGGIDEFNIGRNPKFPYDALWENSDYGFVNLEPDRDGVTRRARMFAIDGDSAYPSLAVAAYAMSEGKRFDEIIPELPAVVSGDPLEAHNELFINYAFSYEKEVYPSYSYVDVLRGEIDVDTLLKDKVVFVGATAAGLFDLKAIPFVSKYAGVFVHANILDNLIAKNWIREIGTEWTTLYILLIGFLFGYLLPRYTPWGQMGLFTLLVGGGVAFSCWLFSEHSLVLHIVPPMLTGIGCWGGVIFYRLVIEEKEKRKIKGSFKQYLSPKIIEIITKDPDKLALGGEEREVTIFFLDIAGFTTMSEALAPTQLVEVMNQCLTQFSNVILKNDGLINKYIGDCIMAFWNAPADQPKHATLACQAALECLSSLPDLNKSFKEKGLPSIDCRVGVNTGTVVVGNMGSNEKFDYTVMGDPVNLASRLEGANKQYHSHVMVSEYTFEQAKGEIEARDLDLIRVKGKSQPIKVFELLSRKDEMPEEVKQGRQKYHEALRMYRQRQFQEAIHGFQEVFDYLPNDHLSRVYLERSRQFAVNPPPPQWDGVFVMKTK